MDTATACSDGRVLTGPMIEMEECGRNSGHEVRVRLSASETPNKGEVDEVVGHIYYETKHMVVIRLTEEGQKLLNEKPYLVAGIPTQYGAWQWTEVDVQSSHSDSRSAVLALVEYVEPDLDKPSVEALLVGLGYLDLACEALRKVKQVQVSRVCEDAELAGFTVYRSPVGRILRNAAECAVRLRQFVTRNDEGSSYSTGDAASIPLES